jgi:hypothetical protein
MARECNIVENNSITGRPSQSSERGPRGPRSVRKGTAPDAPLQPRFGAGACVERSNPSRDCDTSEFKNGSQVEFR